MISEKEQMKKGGIGKRIKQHNSVLHQEVTPRSHPSHAHIACRCSRLILDSTAISGLTTNPVLIGVVAPFPPSLVPTVGIHLGLSLGSTAISALTIALVLTGAELHSLSSLFVFFCRCETMISRGLKVLLIA